MFTIAGDIGNLFEQAVNGDPSPRMLLSTKLQHKVPTSASPDGRFLLYTTMNMDRSRNDVWVLPLTSESKPFALVQRDFDQGQAQFSPDGRWVAYASNESGRYQILARRFVEPLDGPSADPETVVVSTDGGTAPRWRGDGKELYFIAPDGAVMVTDVRGGAQLSVGPPRALFRIAGSHGDWDVDSSGSRFLIAIPAGADASAPFSILWNRMAQLRTTPRS
jgi:Tol biopolymer transport system component